MPSIMSCQLSGKSNSTFSNSDNFHTQTLSREQHNEKLARDPEQIEQYHQEANFLLLNNSAFARHKDFVCDCN